MNDAAFNCDRSAFRQFIHKILRYPFRRLLRLPSAGVKTLVKIAFAIQESDSNQRQIAVRCRANSIAR